MDRIKEVIITLENIKKERKEKENLYNFLENKGTIRGLNIAINLLKKELE